MLVELLPLRVPTLGALALLLVTSLWIRYTARQRYFKSHRKAEHTKCSPLTFPYVFPLLGSLPLGYLWKPRDFVLSRTDFFQSGQPVLIKILTQEFYVIRGPEDVKALFRSSWVCTAIPFVKYALGYAFGLPPSTLRLYDNDDSGSGRLPHPGSTVEPRNRIDYHAHQSLVKLLEGKGLGPFWRRFAGNITGQLHTWHDDIGSDWRHHTDLMKTIGDEVTISILNALCGPYLLSLNPRFLQDFDQFDLNLQTYLQGIPWVFAPKAYAARKRVLNAVKIWEQHARDNYNEASLDADGDDPFWGSSFFRERHAMFLEMDGVDHSAIASQDFGLIWAAKNTITATSWMMFEMYRDPELLSCVRAEIDTCKLTPTDGRMEFDLDRLLHLPILQAAYAETLRLRMHFYIIRMADKTDMNIRDWIIPKQKTIITLTTVAHMDSKAWNTGMDNEHPTDQFWIGRFLKYPSTSDHDNKDCPSPIFSTKEQEGSWIPYGGGPRQCPGRHFAKRQIFLTTALMISLFDCEILEGGTAVREDFTLRGFGSGISHPVGNVPVRMRRRDIKNR